MTSRTALLTATLLAASAPTSALARPTIVVDEAIPFSADDLANAVSIRADSNAQIHVIRQGDVLVITVGDHARTIAVDPASDPHDLARVVALVIVALDAPTSAPSAPATPFAPVAPIPPVAPSTPAPPAPPGTPSPVEQPPGSVPIAAGSTVLFGAGGELPPPKNWTIRLGIGYGMTNYVRSKPIMATVSRRLGPSAHLVVGIGFDQTSIWNGMEYGRVEVSSLPMRAGIELRRRWLAIEAGLAMTRWDDPCLGARYATGGYAAARAYLFPVGAIQNRAFVEAGLRHVTNMGCSTFTETFENRDTAGHVSLGLELPL